jgi:hypothetical protein
MTWHVKSKGAEGKITSTLCHDWQQAVNLCRETQAKGKMNTWIEGVNGQRVGFTLITPAATKL